MKCRFYQSSLTCPYANLALEDTLLRRVLGEDEVILLLYCNRPSIVIGRAQNPWVECDMAALDEEAIPLVRRQSGGGTVYHDLGNLNFSFIASKSRYNKKQHFAVVQRALSLCDIESNLSCRNDLWVGREAEQKKISGNAFRELSGRAFHHGTLLVDARLNDLSRLLKPNETGILAKGVKSVRSPVINLSAITPTLTVPILAEALNQAFNEVYQVQVDSELLDDTYLKQHPQISEEIGGLKSWEWLFGKTLPFTHSLQVSATKTLELVVKKGLIESEDEAINGLAYSHLLVDSLRGAL